MANPSDLEFKAVNEPLMKALEKFANLIDREWPTSVGVKSGTPLIFHSFVLVAEITYRTIIWICADKPDLETIERNPKLVLSAPPLMRTILDEVFTVAFLSEDIETRSFIYHKAGWKELKQQDTRERTRYGSHPKWQEKLKLNERTLLTLAELANVSKAEQSNLSLIKKFPLPGRMHEDCAGSLKDYLIFLNDWYYKQFSQEAHLSGAGLLHRAFPLVLVHTGQISEQFLREKLEIARSSIIATSITLVVALLSEMQATLKFPSVSQELSYLWTLLGRYFRDPKDLYERRYKSLLTTEL